MPVTVSYPGVYIQELPSGVHTITGVATSIAAFCGWANQGPTTPQLVLSWSDYARMYGGLYQGALLGYAVSQFFANGGNQAYIIRLTDSTAAAASTTLAGAPPAGAPAAGTPAGGAPAAPAGTGTITISAATQGAANPSKWANNYGIVIKNQVGSSPPRFSLQVVYNPNFSTTVPTVVESFVNLSPTSPDPQGRYVGDILTAQSNYVMVTANSLTVPPPDSPANATTGQPTTGMQTPQNLGSGAGAKVGTDGTVLTPESPAGPFENALLDPTNGVGGVNQLVHVDLFNLLCVPGEVDPPTVQNLETFCRQHRAFLIADCAQ